MLIRYLLIRWSTDFLGKQRVSSAKEEFWLCEMTHKVRAFWLLLVVDTSDIPTDAVLLRRIR